MTAWEALNETLGKKCHYAGLERQGKIQTDLYLNLNFGQRKRICSITYGPRKIAYKIFLENSG
jgi:hypothetical protein